MTVSKNYLKKLEKLVQSPEDDKLIVLYGFRNEYITDRMKEILNKYKYRKIVFFDQQFFKKTDSSNSDNILTPLEQDIAEFNNEVKRINAEIGRRFEPIR